MNPTPHPASRILYPVLIAAPIALGIYLWDRYTPPPAKINEWVQAKPAAPLATVPRVGVTVTAPVQVYAPRAKTKLKLPPALQQNADVHVLAATQIKADLHPQTVVTTINSETGASETLIRRDPYPWLAAEQTGEIRLDYGIKTGFSSPDKGRPGGVRLSVREDLLQVKALHLGVNASIDSDGQMFAGVGVGWRW
jgi:hypothetical protein